MAAIVLTPFRNDRGGHMIGWAFKHVLVWSLVFGAAYYAISHREAWFPHLSVGSSQAEKQAQTNRKTNPSSRTIVLRADRQGHFWIEGRVNHADVHFMIDTGATGIALSRQDAATAGIHLQNRDFTLESHTANGIVRTAPVEIRTLEVGPLTVRGIPAQVIDGPMTGMALLGMSFLRRLDSFELRGDTLTLRW